MDERDLIKEFCEKYNFLLRDTSDRLGIAFNLVDVEEESKIEHLFSDFVGDKVVKENITGGILYSVSFDKDPFDSSDRVMFIDNFEEGYKCLKES